MPIRVLATIKIVTADCPVEVKMAGVTWSVEWRGGQTCTIGRRVDSLSGVFSVNGQTDLYAYDELDRETHQLGVEERTCMQGESDYPLLDITSYSKETGLYHHVHSDDDPEDVSEEVPFTPSELRLCVSVNIETRDAASDGVEVVA